LSHQGRLPFTRPTVYDKKQAMFKRGLVFCTPWMNAAGALGFAPEMRSDFDWSRLGAFLTDPVSQAPRQPADSRGGRLRKARQP